MECDLDNNTIIKNTKYIVQVCLLMLKTVRRRFGFHFSIFLSRHGITRPVDIRNSNTHLDIRGHSKKLKNSIHVLLYFLVSHYFRGGSRPLYNLLSVWPYTRPGAGPPSFFVLFFFLIRLLIVPSGEQEWRYIIKFNKYIYTPSPVSQDGIYPERFLEGGMTNTRVTNYDLQPTR